AGLPSDSRPSQMQQYRDAPLECSSIFHAPDLSSEYRPPVQAAFVETEKPDRSLLFSSHPYHSLFHSLVGLGGSAVSTASIAFCGMHRQFPNPHLRLNRIEDRYV